MRYNWLLGMADVETPLLVHMVLVESPREPGSIWWVLHICQQYYTQHTISVRKRAIPFERVNCLICLAERHRILGDRVTNTSFEQWGASGEEVTDEF